MKSGIYQFQSKLFPDRIYVGSAINLKQREGQHKRRLIAGIHPNKRLLGHVTKYGIADITYTVLETCRTNELITREQHYIDTLQPSFNICRIAGNTIGRPQSQATRDKRRKAMLARTIPQSMRYAMRIGKYNQYPIPCETNGFKIISVSIDTPHRTVMYECPLCLKLLQSTYDTLKKRKRLHCGCGYANAIRKAMAPNVQST